jgi:RNA polymerase sigma factor (TIGR02999 family)
LSINREATDPHATGRNAGPSGTWEELIPTVYEELRAMARRQLRREREDHTLSTTALAHEVYLKLADSNHGTRADRAHFLGIAARVMRRVLIDYARQHNATKRPGGAGRKRVLLETTLAQSLAVIDERAEMLVAIDDALTRLTAIEPRLAQVVEFRFFGDLTEEETAAAMGVTARTVRRDWIKAKAWLQQQLQN